MEFVRIVIEATAQPKKLKSVLVHPDRFTLCGM
jgi:hypothetical protein